MQQNFLSRIIPQIQINSNIGLIGQKGCGKSSAGQKIFQPIFPRKVIFDTKGEYFESGTGIYHCFGYSDFFNKFSKLIQFDQWTIIFHHEPSDGLPENVLNEICRNIYEAEEIYIVIEEIHLLSTPHKVPYYLLQIVTTGRSRNIGYMITSTRAGLINNSLLSEIDIYLIGRQIQKSDQDAFAPMLGESRKRLGSLQNFQFAFYTVKTNELEFIET